MRHFFESKISVFFISVLLVGLFTVINNYFFYKYAELEANRKNREVFSLINSMYNSCIKSRGYNIDCNENIIEIVSDARIRGGVEIYVNDELVHYNTTHRFNLDRKRITFKEKLSEEIAISLSVLTTPPLWQSTLRSISLSVYEWPRVISSDQDFKKFLANVALPRSAPAISAMIATAIFVWFLIIHTKYVMRRRIETTLSLYDNSKEKETIERELEQAIRQREEVSSKLELYSESHHELLLKLAQKESDLDYLKAQSNKNQSEYEKEILDLLKEREDLEVEAYKLISEIDEFRDKENNLIKENEDLKLKLQENDKKRSAIRGKKFVKLNSEQKLLAKYLLLEAPEVERCKDFSSKIGKHHSKDLIDDFSKSLRSNDDVSEIIESVVSHAYNSKKQGRVELYREVDNSFYLVVYFLQSDAGFSAKIKLSGKNQWQSMAQAKYILASISKLEEYTLIDKS